MPGSAICAQTNQPFGMAIQCLDVAVKRRTVIKKGLQGMSSVRVREAVLKVDIVHS